MNLNRLNEWLVGIENSDMPTKLFENLKEWQTTNYVYIDYIDKQTNSIVLDCLFSVRSSRISNVHLKLNIPYPLPVEDYKSFYQLFLDCLSEQYPELLI